MRRICEISVTFDFIFRLVHCSSSKNVSFNSIWLNVLEGIKQFYLLMLFKKTRLETPFKRDNVKTLVKTSTLRKLGPLFLWERPVNCSFCYAFFFGFGDQTIVWKWFRLPPNDQKNPRYPLVLKLNVTLARPLRLVILYLSKRKILTDDRRLYLHDSKWNSRSNVDGLTHTKQLLNLFII